MKILKELTSVKLEDLEPGRLFMYGTTLAVKSEYKSESGAIEAYIVGSGSMFWGGTSSPKEQSQILVFPCSVHETSFEMKRLY